MRGLFSCLYARETKVKRENENETERTTWRSRARCERRRLLSSFEAFFIDERVVNAGQTFKKKFFIGDS